MQIDKYLIIFYKLLLLEVIPSLVEIFIYRFGILGYMKV